MELGDKFKGMAFRRCLFLVVLGVVLGACSKESRRKPKIFFGECKIEVNSKTPGAEILLDGIFAGEGSVKGNIPCGEKQIRVEKHGFTPYISYAPVSVDQPLKITVELEKLEVTPDFALSKELVEIARKGRKIRNPWTDPASVNEPDPVEAAPVAVAAPGGAAAPAAGTEAVVPGAFSSNLEDWR